MIKTRRKSEPRRIAVYSRHMIVPKPSDGMRAEVFFADAMFEPDSDGTKALCLSPKLDPNNFVGEFEASAIACVHGEAIKRDSQ